MHKWISKLTIIGSDNGLSPGRRQAIIWTNAGILLIGPLGTNFSEILIKIYASSFKKMHLKMLSAKCLPFCLGLNMLTHLRPADTYIHPWTESVTIGAGTVKPVCNDHLYNKIHYLWFIWSCVLMKTEGTNLLLLTISAFWSSSRWPLAT